MSGKFLLALTLISTVAYSQSNEHLKQFPVTSGSVSSIVTGDTYTVLRGNFNSIGTYQGNAAIIDATTGAHDTSWPIFHGYAYDGISDNNGGWFVAGNSEANGTHYLRLVHVNPDKTIDESWTPNPNNSVYAMALDGNTLYVGGVFTQIAGTTRNRLAAFDVTTGNLLPWNPDMPSGRIEKLTVAGGIVYVGGLFTTIGGQARKNLAAIDASTGVVTAWNPTVDGTNSSVQDIDVSGSLVYVSGFFTVAGGQSRRSIAALDITTGNATAWNPNPNNNTSIIEMALSATTMYIGGTFTTVGGISREYLAEISLSTGILTSWDPNFDDFTVYDLELSGTTLYVAGSFSTVNGLEHANLVAVSTVNGTLLSWSPVPGEWVTGMTLFGNTLFVEGGDDSNFEFNWQPTNDFAIIDNETGEIFLSDLDIGSSTISYAITNGNTLYISGDFTEVNGEPRAGLAAVDIPSGTVLPWEPVTDGQVATLSVSGSVVFMGGNFSSANGTPRSALAAVDAVSGNLLSMSYDFDGGEIFSSFTTATTLYVGGNFSSINASSRNNIAAITISNGNISSWNPTNLSLFDIVKIEANTNWVVVKNSSNTVIVLEASSSNTNIEFSEELNDFALTGDILFLGTTLEDDFGDNGLAAFDLTSGDYTSWDPDVGSDSDGYPAIKAVGTADDLIFVGGDFTGMGFEYRENFGAYYLTATPNQAPVIVSTVTGVSIGGIVTINLLPLIGDPDDNLDFSTLGLVTNLSEQGASAEINSSYELILDYGGIKFFGTDRIGISVCDLLDECTEQELTIEVGGDIIVYNAISANGDEQNDRLRIQNLEAFGNNKVTIFNRWGDVVFEISNYNNEDRVFTGVNKNDKELPAGTYYYKIEFSGKTKTGYLSLKR